MSSRRSRIRSISVPITMGAIAVPMSAALLVGWTVLFGQKIAREQEIAVEVWLLVLGAISFTVIIAVLVLLSYFLVREILEVRRQNSFIDSVTHELKTPLASLRLCLETLDRPELDEQQGEQLHKMMRHDVERLTDFIDDILQASRLSDQGESLLNLSDVNVHELVDELESAATRRHGLPDDAIIVEVPTDLVVCTDRFALSVVLRNLIDNAIKYSNDPVRVTVKATPREDEKGGVVVEVHDEGIGIPKPQLKRVFNRFYRVEHEKVRARKGTGLGLFVVWQLVRNLGGKVDAESEGPGEGTTMRVALPDLGSA